METAEVGADETADGPQAGNYIIGRGHLRQKGEGGFFLGTALLHLKKRLPSVANLAIFSKSCFHFICSLISQILNI
ncbi:MAG: hypothetical protein B1H40_01720 [Candidatus Latescibacteria bacterium 4484_181]|nr:MAG: hypothetical protein B1H40_01720 [Candidatus Latescibacteria bacterium 4484_181]RKY72894.1 MAG: hypothetical protein DRQ24_03940 [Candidatus Latescibacterota bacterium]